MPQHSFKVIEAEHDEIRDRLDVQLALLEGKKTVEVRSLGFPPTITDKQLKIELRKYAATYFDDLVRGREEKVREARRAEIKRRLSSLVNKQEPL